ncbi:MAG: rhamnan synthesis F family protein [Salinivirgaceae bacterium]|nr:rhamnan synthesis F family protein [Salinivirgaceae bacterium]MDD4746151.1 rhamnan synthesis F family protein [Salinivirgaceae bacterium]
MKSLFKKISASVKQSIIWLWWHMPFNRAVKHRIKDRFFRTFGFLFRNTKPYKNWLAIRNISSAVDFDSLSSYPDNWSVKELDLPSEEYTRKPINIARVVFVIHAFYPEVFGEILEQLSREFSGKETKRPIILVSTTANSVDVVNEMLGKALFQFQVFQFDNRGRDILPFLRILKNIDDDGVMIVKIHTKKSNHRLTGDLWRKELFDSLLTAKNIFRGVTYFNHNPNVGIIGPKGHLVPMSLYFGGNALALQFFCGKFGISVEVLKSLNFVAGSMFFARLSALQPLLDLEIPDEMFEQEAGQNDGTMAHAIERVFSLSCALCNMGLVDTSFPKSLENLGVTKDHPYTW